MIVTHPRIVEAVSGLPLHDATDLTGGGIQAQIRLNDQIYTLRITKAGKLILTK
ncbi:hemin uptake protein HemP [Plastorhodobacter daqingensis]|uniref:Hemin uptake protein HemP n=1 Tax=Plastorhodobacter daqingensis TaxID=1387281 RepID=A0ABW2UDJ9_9RHOB